MSRRSLFVLGIALFFGARRWFAVARNHAPRPLSDSAAVSTSLERLLSSCLPTPRVRNAAVQLGAHCVRQLPASAVQLDRDGVPLTFRADLRAGASPGELQTRARDLRESDLRAGRCVNVDGWVLSDTEVALCCAAHRVHQRTARV